MTSPHYRFFKGSLYTLLIDNPVSEYAYVLGAREYYEKPIAGINLLMMVQEEGIPVENFFQTEEEAFNAARKKHPNTAFTILTLSSSHPINDKRKTFKSETDILKIRGFNTKENIYSKVISAFSLVNK